MVAHDNSLDLSYQYLLIAAFFLLPLTVVGNNIAIWVIVLLWIFSGNYSTKFQQIKKNKFAISSILFFSIHLVGLLWTENISWGLEIVRKMLPFFFVMPIFLTITKMKNIKYYIFAFLIALSFSEFLSYLIWFGVIEPFGSANLYNPTPLMGHISYNPFLAFGIYLVIYHLLSKKDISLFERASYTFFVLSMTINMFITGGRAGQVMFFVFLALIAYQFFRNSQIKAVIISVLLSIFISIAAYYSSTIFQNRVNTAVNDVINYNKDIKDTSLGLRITFLVNSFELIKNSPFIGVGTGDFPDEYDKVNKINTPQLISTVQPHNMYILVLSQFGLLGLVSFLAMFYYQFKIASESQNHLIKNVGIAIPVLFLVIMWSDSYLLGHFTGNLFILFSALIYSDKE